MGTLSRGATAIFVSHLIGINSKKKELAPLGENSFRVNPLSGMSSASGKVKAPPPSPPKTDSLCKNAEHGSHKMCGMHTFFKPENSEPIC